MSNPTSVLFIHGIRSSSATWIEQERAMQKLGYHTLALDLPGHGSRVGETFTIERAFEMIDENIKLLGGKVVLIGMSLGGYVCLAYAAQYPQQVEAVLAAGCSTETARFSTRAYRFITSKSIDLWHASTKAWLKPKQFLPNEEPGWEVVTQMLGEVSRMSSLANLRALKVPLWLVSGRWCPLRFGELNSLRARPDAHHFIVPKAGHDVNLDAPHAFNAIMEKMLVSLPVTS